MPNIARREMRARIMNAPEWGWFWRSALLAARWSGVGVNVWDVASRQLSTATGTMQTVLTPRGFAGQTLGTGTNKYLKILNPTGFNPTDRDWSLILVLRTGSSWGITGGAHIFSQESGSECFANIDDSPAGRFNWRGAGGASTIGDLVFNTNYVLGITHDALASEVKGYINGDLVATFTSNTPTTSTGDFRLMNHSSSTSRAMSTHALEAVYLLTENVPESGMAAIARDPFGPWQQRIVADVRQPIADHLRLGRVR